MSSTGQVQLLEVEGYRSIHGLDIRFDRVNLITGPNGCGKSNLFNAFKLLKSAMQGRLAAAIAEEGGMTSILWAGPRKEQPARMRVSVKADPFEYRLELGLRPQSECPLFPLDPQIKREIVKLAGRIMVDRKTSTARVRCLDGVTDLRIDLVDSESIFAQSLDPERYPYLYSLRESVERWIFYHEFRTDAGSPLRRPAAPTYSPRLKEDGSNLGPALYVISRRGEAEMLTQIVEEAIPGTNLVFHHHTIELEHDGIMRPMDAREMSDGTLKFLCLAAACFSVHHPPLIAFNEPETSLNPRAFGPLADMLAYCAQFSQLWITTHSEALVKDITNRLDCRPIRLDMVEGETMLDGFSNRMGYRSEDYGAN